MNDYPMSKIRLDALTGAFVDLPQAIKAESNPSTMVVGVARNSALTA